MTHPKVLTKTIANIVSEAQRVSEVVEKKILTRDETLGARDWLPLVRSIKTRKRMLQKSRLTDRPWSPWGQRLCRARRAYGEDIVDLVEEILKQDRAENHALVASHSIWRYYSDREISKRLRQRPSDD